MNLVTGATGFIGRHLARRLVRERQPVRVLCRLGSEGRLPSEILGAAEIAIGDLRDPGSLLRACAGAGRVFHCAGHVSDWGSQEAFFAMNVQGTRWLLEAAKAAAVQRVVHLSSIAAFGTPAPPYFDDHSGYGRSKDGYSRTKVEGEKIAFEFHQAGLPVTVLRPAVVYGPEGAWLEEPLRMIEKGRMFLLGGGEGTCHPCYIENLLDAMLLAADHPRARGQGYIVADGESISFREYFDAIASIARKGPIRRSLPLPAARAIAIACEAGARLRSATTRPLLTQTAIEMVTSRSRMSIEKIRTELGWEPRYTFGSAIDELRRWYSEKRPALGLSQGVAHRRRPATSR
jgi:nucleoside-diphosphate-sugar epimerase